MTEFPFCSIVPFNGQEKRENMELVQATKPQSQSQLPLTQFPIRVPPHKGSVTSQIAPSRGMCSNARASRGHFIFIPQQTLIRVKSFLEAMAEVTEVWGILEDVPCT